MTVTAMPPEAAEEIEKTMARLARATVAYMTRLKDIADVATLAPGLHGYDYAVTVDERDFLQVIPRLAGLTFDIEDEFGVKITTLAVAGQPGMRT